MKYVGIDWATREHRVALVDEEGNVLDEWRVAHQPLGVKAFIDRLILEGGPPCVIVAIESGAPLLMDQILAAGFTVYAINPKQSDRFRDRHSMAGAKDDRRDALVLANAVRTDRRYLRPLRRDSDLTEAIRAHDRARTRLVEQRAALGNQLSQILARVHPAIATLRRDHDDPFVLALLRQYPEATRSRVASRSEVSKLMIKYRVRVTTPDDVLKRLISPGFVIPGYVIDAGHQEVLDLVDLIERLNDKIKAADQRLRELTSQHPYHDLLLSLPGLADRLIVRMIAGIGDDPSRATDPRILRAFAGTAPVTRRTGESKTGRVIMRRGCNRSLQAAFFTMARCSVPGSPWAKQYLAHLKLRGVKHATAVRSLSNKWAKILSAVLRTRQPYDEARHVGTLLRRNVAWAASLTPLAEPRHELV